MSALTVSVIMPVRDDSPAYRRALSAIRAAAPAPDEVIVVTDGPSPGAAEAARIAGFRVVQHERGGPAAARNAGVRLAVSDILLFVDADVAVHADLIGRVRAVLADPAVAAAVGCYDDAPPESNFFSEYKNLLQRFVHLQARPEGSTFWGACGAMRREIFLEAGGFDERFRRPSVEDIELGYRIKAAGHRIVFRPDLEITHLKRWTFGSLLASDVFRRALPWTWLLIRESAIEPDLNLRYESRIAAGLALVLVAAIGIAFIEPRALVAAAAAATGLVAIDWRLARFFHTRRGAWFAIRAVAWHWVYYLYSTAAFALAVLLYPVIGRQLVAPREGGPRPVRDQRRGESW